MANYAAMEDLMTPREVAAAMKVGLSTVSRWARNGHLDPIRVGKVLRFRRSDIEALQARNNQPEPAAS